MRHGVDIACRVVIWAALAAGIVGASWWFGGVGAEAQWWLAVALLAAACSATLRMFVARDSTLPTAPIVLPILLGLALVVGWFQTIPLPIAWHARLSPQAAAWFDRLPAVPSPSADRSAGSPDGAFATAARPGQRPLSLVPSATRHHLALLILAATAFWVAQSTVQSPQARLGFLVLLSLNGAIVSLFGMVQQLTGSDKLYWRIAIPEGAVPFASYVNRNNAAGYLNLALGAAVGALFWTSLRYRFNVVQPRMRGHERRPPHRAIGATEWLAQLDALSLTALGLVVTIVAGVVSSASRGGAIALVMAGIVVGVVVVWGRRSTAPWIGLALCVPLAISMALWLGLGEQLGQRLAGLMRTGQWHENVRLLHWRDGWQAAQDFWRAGSGLGTYRYTYDPYEQRAEPRWYQHAENQYLESLVEAGIVGPLLLVAAIVWALVALHRRARLAEDPETYALAISGLFAVVSQVVHASFDFGLYLPANAITFAALCGAATSRGARRALSADSASWWSRGVRRWPLVAPLLLVTAAAAWATIELHQTAGVERAAVAAGDPSPRHTADATQLRQAIATLQRLSERRPDDAPLHERLADHWIRLYRLEASELLSADLANNNLAPHNLWSLTSPIALHARAHQLSKDHQLETLARLRDQPHVRRELGPAWAHLLAARNICPTRPQVHLAIAELCPLFDTLTADEAHVRRAVALAPHDPDVLYYAGRLHLQAGRSAAGIALWRTCLSLTSEYRDQMLHYGPRLLGPVDLFEQLFADMPEQLIDLAQTHYGGEAQRATRYQLADLAEQQLAAGTWDAWQRTVLQARIAWLRDDVSAARQHFEKALALSSKDESVSLHYDYARFLLATGDPRAAQHHAEFCLRLEPELAKHRRLIQELRRAREPR